MKLRIKGSSIRLRISPSDMEKLLVNGRVEETIHFGPEDDAKLTYALQHDPLGGEITLRYQAQTIAIVISTQCAQEWAQGEEVGIYGTAGGLPRRLEIAVEKDFACLDKSESENQDTYAHPKQGAAC